MGKKSAPRALDDKAAKAVARNLRVSPQKLNLVAQLIRGKKVSTALADLEFSQKRIAGEVRKTLESAIANAENNHNLDVDELVVAQAWTGKNLVLKRFHARGRGRGAGILKPFSEVTIILREQKAEDKDEKRAAPKKGAKDAGKKPRAPARPRREAAKKEQA
jgi:large subunit ribosomal protein L22